MNLLDKDQIRLIEADVKNAKIILENLSHELVDHICCEVENQMSKDGKSFEEAYTQIKKETGITVLQKIQENTLYLTNKKYAIMKTTMKITGNVSLALLAIGTVFKIFHWPGASPMLVLGFSLLCLFFFPSAIYINQKEGGAKGRLLINLSILFGGIAFMAGILFKVMHWPEANVLLLSGWTIILLLFLPLFLSIKLKEANSTKEKRIYILGAIALIIFECSTLFKIFHWPGAAILMLTGFILLVSVFLPMFTYMKFKETGKITGQYIFVIIISMYAVVLTSLLTMNVSGDLLGQFVKDEANSAQISQYLKKNEVHVSTQSIADTVSSTSQITVSSVSEESDRLLELIFDIKLRLVREIDQVNRETALNSISNPEMIRKKDNSQQVHTILLNKNGEGLAKALKAGIDRFRTIAVAAFTSDADLSERISKLLSTSLNEMSSAQSWEDENFSHNMLISTLAYLSGLEKNIRMIESEAIRNIKQNNL